MAEEQQRVQSRVASSADLFVCFTVSRKNSICTPIRNDPDTLITKVRHGKPMPSRFVDVTPTRKRTIDSIAPPSPTAAQNRK